MPTEREDYVPLKDRPGGRTIGKAHIHHNGDNTVTVTAHIMDPSWAAFHPLSVSFQEQPSLQVDNRRSFLFKKPVLSEEDKIDQTIIAEAMQQMNEVVSLKNISARYRVATEDDLKRYQENIEAADQRALFETFDAATYYIKSRLPIPNDMGRDVHHLMMESIDRFGNSNDPVGDYYLKRIREGLFSGEIASTGLQDEEGHPIYLITQFGDTKQVSAEELLNRLKEENQASTKNIVLPNHDSNVKSEVDQAALILKAQGDRRAFYRGEGDDG